MTDKYMVGDLVRTSKGLVRVDKFHDDGTYTVTLDKVVTVRGKVTNVFRAHVVPHLVLDRPEQFDD